MLIPLINLYTICVLFDRLIRDFLDEDVKSSIAKGAAIFHNGELIIDQLLMLHQTAIRAKDFSAEIGR